MNFKDIEIIYEDNHLLVVNKPINMLSQGDKTEDVDLHSLMKEYIRVTYNKPNEAYLGLVHRLDRVTGGVMVFAKTSKAASRLSNQIRENKWKKYYYAIVDNIPNKDQAELINYLHKNTKTNTSYVKDESFKNSKKAILNYKVIATYNNLALLDIQLITGRHHQIRVQLSNINSPIYGDHRYNVNHKEKSHLKLFAYKLEIYHPTKKDKMTFILDKPSFGMWKCF